MKKRTDRQRQIARCDALHREFIRRRAMLRVGGCERCLKVKASFKDLDTAHCHGRGKHSVRWDERNSLGLCGGCHRHIDAQLSEKEALFRRILGDDYDRLFVLANMSSKQSGLDLTMVEIYLKQLLKGME